MPAAAKNLFTPLKAGSLAMKNRMVLSPLTRARASENNVPGALQAEYYAQRASMGLLITEGTCISQQAMGWHCAPGIFREDQVEAWKATTKAVHDKGGLIATQLWHLGRAMHSDVSGQEIVAPSAIKLENPVTVKNSEKKDAQTPHALTEEEVAAVVEDFGKAAGNAMKAGFDAVEVHGANGYLVDGFLQSKTNQRTDKYGGSPENRVRFLTEILDRILKSVPADKVGVRLSPNGTFNEMGSADNFELFTLAVRELAKRKIAFLDLMDNGGFGFHELCEMFTCENAKKIINEEGAPTVVFGNVGYTKETGTKAVAEGHADGIAYGRPTISNPDLAIRFENNLPLNPDAEYADWWTSAKGAEGYTSFPMVKAPEEKQA